MVETHSAKSDAMINNPKKRLTTTLQGFLQAEEAVEERYGKAIELANDTGFSEVVLGLMQIRKDTKNHRDALELMLLGIENE